MGTSEKVGSIVQVEAIWSPNNQLPLNDKTPEDLSVNRGFLAGQWVINFDQTA